MTVEKKYHINAAGDVKPCKATQRACRYGGEQSHYATEKEAREAFEKKQQAIVTTLSSTTQLQEKVDTLVKSFLSPDGDFLVPVVIPNSSQYFYEANYSINVHTPEGFAFLGSGVEHVVYTDSERKFVYKVENHELCDYFYKDRKTIDALKKNLGPLYAILSERDRSASLGGHLAENYQEEWQSAKKLLQQSYASIDDQKLYKNHGIRLAKTMFLSTRDNQGNEIPVIVQEYFDPNEWKSHRLAPNQLEDDFPDINDVHGENVLRNTETGEIVLIDWFYAFDAH